MEFPTGYPWSFGDPAYLTAEDIDGAEASGIAYERRVDLIADGLALLLNQFRDKPRLRAVAAGLIDGVQDCTNAIWQLMTERWVDTAIGGQLDGIGDFLDFARAGRLDETYRAFLRARVLVLRSDGSWPTLVKILAAIGLTVAARGVRYELDAPAAFVVRVADTLPDEVTGADVFSMLEAARNGGVRLTLIAPVSPIGETFRFAAVAELPLVESARGLGSVNDPSVGGHLGGVNASSVES